MNSISNVGINVIDEFKGNSLSEIKETLKTNALPFAPLMTQIHGDFNFSTVVRNANAFGAKEVFYFGPRKKWDRRGAVGTYLMTDVRWLSSIEEILELRKEYPHFVAMDIIPGISKSIENYVWKPGTILFFGEEQQGLQKEILDICDEILHIPQRGSVRSINVGTASGITMHEVMKSFST